VSSNWDKRLAPWFEKRRWRVQAEFDGEVTVGGIGFTFDKGVFDIDLPGVFVTPFGSRGRHGIAIIEVDPDGKDVPGSAVAFGESVLRRASELFGTISGLSAENGEEEG
jgi:hypothetical protein